jgi:hypothetical protein
MKASLAASRVMRQGKAGGRSPVIGRSAHPEEPRMVWNIGCPLPVKSMGYGPKSAPRIPQLDAQKAL